MATQLLPPLQTQDREAPGPQIGTPLEELHPGLAVLAEMEANEADASDLTATQISTLRQLFADRTGLGLYMFTYWICGARELYPPLHYDICQFLSNWGRTDLVDGTHIWRPIQENDQPRDSWRRLMLCIPRDHFKTTIGTRALPLWLASHNPELTFGIFNENENKCKSWIGATKKVIENSRLYHVLWPQVLPPGIHFNDRARGNTGVPRSWKWGDTGIMLQRESSMVAELTMEPFGIAGAVAGKHFTHVIKDDIIGQKASESESEMETANNWVDHSRAIERPAEGGCELINYTRWGYNDTYAHIGRRWPSDYKIYLRHLLETPDGTPDIVNGKSIFPTRITTAHAKRMYADNPQVFMSQYMCIPMAGRDTAFQPSWIRYGQVVTDDTGRKHFFIDAEHYNKTIMVADLRDTEGLAPIRVRLADCNRAIIVDPAPSTRAARTAEPRANNGIVVVAKDPWGRKLHLEGVPLRDDPTSVLYEVLRLCAKWDTLTVAVEEVAFSAWVAPLWNRIVQHEFPGVHISWLAVKPQDLRRTGTDKDQRILSMSPDIREGFWYFNRETSGYTVQELLEFPYSLTKDLIDAMAYTDVILGRPDTPDEQQVASYAARSLQDGRGRYTRY